MDSSAAVHNVVRTSFHNTGLLLLTLTGDKDPLTLIFRVWDSEGCYEGTPRYTTEVEGCSSDQVSRFASACSGGPKLRPIRSSPDV